MVNIWFFLTLLIDAIPSIVMHYIMFKDRMRYSFAKSLAITVGCTVVYDLLICFLYGGGYISAGMMVGMRMMIFILLLGMKFYLIPNYVLQNIYMVLLILPYVLVGIATSAVFVGLVKIDNAAPFMIITVGRIIFTIITVFPIYSLWNKFVMPSIDIPNKNIWYIANGTLFFLNLAICATVNTDYAQNGVDIRNLLLMLFLMGSSLFISSMLFYAISIMSSLIRAEEYSKQEQMLIRLQESQYKAMTSNIEETKRLRHDLRHHISLIMGLLEEEKVNEAKEYIQNYSSSIPTSHVHNICADPALNALLGHCTDMAQESDININMRCEPLSDCNINSIELCILLGNAIENAIEACREVTDVSKRFINVGASVNAGRLFITVDNSFNGNVCIDSEDIKSGLSFMSAKRGYKEQGYGMSSIKSVAAKHGGLVNTRSDQKTNVFSLSVTMRA